jgi:hypothetical protein
MLRSWYSLLINEHVISSCGYLYRFEKKIMCLLSASNTTAGISWVLDAGIADITGKDILSGYKIYLHILLIPLNDNLDSLLLF